MSENIIDLFKKNNGYYSGAKISAELGITRAAVWKKITALRKKGFIIEAVPSKGYRLVRAPDLSEDYIKSGAKGSLWKDIFVYDRVSSTNELAMSLATKDDLRTNIVIIADSQEKGKGRLGRQWVSPPGGNIYMSLVLRPKLETRDATMLTLLTAVVCAHAIKKISSLPVSIKWPNDLIISRKKLGGILTEIRTDIDKVNLAVIGIGINVNMEAEDFTDEIRSIATSIKEESGQYCSRNELVVEILRQFERFYNILIKQGKHPLLNEWKALSSTIGKNIKVVIGDETVIGFAEDIDDNGMLILKLDSGLRRQISAGDVTLLR
ncbi:MAG: biotin--[acetyl-CoA-carboxylase] ligase [Nitrospira bacterium HGW-Nitrospira-1]|nr:MAG: biotin--[acetyl-CoA-carboxylase] ligase [Nitrospira bacterium HGW-Nitrospira-1]